jgi:hypothetical protein
MAHWHPLIPFSAYSMRYSVKAKAERVKNKLFLVFELTDPHNEILWQAQKDINRQDYLWESTCFEAFIGAPHQSQYYELNLSPTRAWNLYRFTDYRTPNNMPPIAVLEHALIKFDVDGKTISVEIDLTALKLADIEIQLGLTAVIKASDTLHYFAIRHPVLHADFHNQQGWAIRLLPDALLPKSNS